MSSFGTLVGLADALEVGRETVEDAAPGSDLELEVIAGALERVIVPAATARLDAESGSAERAEVTAKLATSPLSDAQPELELAPALDEEEREGAGPYRSAIWTLR